MKIKTVLTDKEVCGEYFRKFNPRSCPVKLRDADGKTIGACLNFLANGKCEVHGQIYAPE